MTGTVRCGTLQALLGGSFSQTPLLLRPEVHAFRLSSSQSPRFGRSRPPDSLLTLTQYGLRAGEEAWLAGGRCFTTQLRASPFCFPCTRISLVSPQNSLEGRSRLNTLVTPCVLQQQRTLIIPAKARNTSPHTMQGCWKLMDMSAAKYCLHLSTTLSNHTAAVNT